MLPPEKDRCHRIGPSWFTGSMSHWRTGQDSKSARRIMVRLQDWKQEFQRPHHSPGPVIASEPQNSYLENQDKSDLHLSEHAVRFQCLWNVLRFWIRDRVVSWCCLASNEHYTSCRMEHFWTEQLLLSLKCKNYHMQETRHRHLKEKIYCSKLNKCIFSPAIFHSIISWNFLKYENSLFFFKSPFISLHSPPPLPFFFVGLKKNRKKLKEQAKRFTITKDCRTYSEFWQDMHVYPFHMLFKLFL